MTDVAVRRRAGVSIAIGVLAAAALAIVAIVPALTPSIGSTADASAADGVTISGQLFEQSGSAAVGEPVTLVARVLDEATGALMPNVLDTVLTDESGSYVVRATASAIARFADAGTAQLEISGQTDTDIVFYNFVATVSKVTAKSGRVTKDASIDGDHSIDLNLQANVGAVDEPVTRAMSRQRIAEHSGASLAADEDDYVIRPESPDDVSVAELVENDDYPAAQPSDVGDERALSSDGRCTSIIWWAQDRWRRALVPMQTLSTLNKSTQEYSWNTTTQTKMQVAITGSYGHSAGGLTTSTVKDTSAGIIFEVNHDYTTRRLSTQWEFRRSHAICVEASSVPGQSTQYFIPKFQWSPHHWTGGSRKPLGTVFSGCDPSNRVPMSGNTSVARTTTLTWGGWVTIAGVTIDNSQTGSTSTRLTIKPNGPGTTYVCGWDDEPIYAVAVKEVR